LTPPSLPCCRQPADPIVRRYALIALIERGSAAAIPVLEQAARADDPALRQVAQRGLQRLSP
jgi:HEAT repeat protein